MALQDLRGLLDQDLELPIGGKTYKIPPPPARVGLRLQLMRDAASMRDAGVELNAEDLALLKVDDDEEASFYEWTLRTAYQEMLADGVTLPEIKVASAGAFLFWTAASGHGQEELEAFWAAQGDPPNASTEQQTPTPVVRGSAPTVEASTTKRRNSGSGTTSRKASKRGKAPRALRSAS